MTYERREGRVGKAQFAVGGDHDGILVYKAPVLIRNLGCVIL